MSAAGQPTKAEAMHAAGRAFAEAFRLLDELPVEEAARRAYTPTGPPLAELEERIRARRAARDGADAA